MIASHSSKLSTVQDELNRALWMRDLETTLRVRAQARQAATSELTGLALRFAGAAAALSMALWGAL